MTGAPARTGGWDGVGLTCLLTAALRAHESSRPDRLFEDRYAEGLAGPEGFRLLEAVTRLSRRCPDLPSTVSYNAVRTRWLDDRLLGLTRAGVRQIVVAAAGMDTRAYRLAWPTGVTVFELDRVEVLAAKQAGLAAMGAVPLCRRVAVGADLLDPDWPAALLASGYRPERPSAWLLEGLLYYLSPDAVDLLLARFAALLAPGSTVDADVISASSLAAPQLREMLDLYRDWGAPWQWGDDDPLAVWRRHGYQADAVEPGEPGRRLGRWTAADLAAAQIVRLWFVRARR